MKRNCSIRVKFFAAISVVALVFIGVLLCLNLFFYDDYYFMARKRELKTTYQSVWRSYNGGGQDIASVLDELESRGGTRLAVIGSDGKILYVSSFSPDAEQREGDYTHSPPMMDFWGDQRFRSLEVLSAAASYMDWAVLEKSKSQLLTVSLRNDQYLCLIGLLDDDSGDYLIAYTPYAYIKNNTTFNLTFLLIAGGCSLLFCLVCAFFISRQFSKPLIEMAGVADRMSELDFSTKYEGNESDEIGKLGSSLNRLSAYLEQAIGELQKTNERLGKEIKEKERIDNMRREFIVNVSHELKTPIALIQGYAEGLTAGVADDPEDRKYYCDTIADEAKRMNRLVMQLLSLSKLELGAEQTYYEDVDLRSLCDEAVQKASVLCESRGIKLSCDATNACVRTDGGLLEQVLMNYLSNAIRYTDDGGMIKLTALQTANGARISVFNEGEGLPEDELTKIWDKFYRTDRARARVDGGTGIGLSLVRAIADTLKGSCGAKNAEGGILFWFEFPDAPIDELPNA